jgi:L-seryl-tRNA(Ser) seleniumtransferase
MSLRDLPSVDRLASELAVGDLPRPLVVEEVRRAVGQARADLARGGETSAEELARAGIERLGRERPTTVVNATGVILHTNLGRALLSPAAASAATTAQTGYGNVEIDLATGERGARASYLRKLAATLTGSEDALIVNNNAGALFLVLMALALGRPVPVSRGEMIEIGGSYRLPELLAASGARLVEIGTTNRTRVADYAATMALQPALLLKVHPSNFRVEGFTEETALSDLVALGRESGVPVVFDAGSGLLDSTTPWLPKPPDWLVGEPGIRQAVALGTDLVLFSGDKLLGGPQAGVIVGRAAHIELLSRHPAARALRIDAATTSALTATLEAYADGHGGDLPLWQVATLPYRELEARAESVLTTSQVKGVIVSGHSTIGAGSAPGSALATPLIEVEAPESAYFDLLKADPPILARRQAGRLLIDVRTVDPASDLHLAAALRAACQS